jgi:serine/threonine-protein kinase
VGSLFAAIATEPPDLEQVAKAPRPVRNLIERCLRKDPKTRLRDIGDARVELEEVLAGRVEPEPVATTPRSRFVGMAVIALLFGGTIGMLRPWQSRLPAETDPPPILRYSIALPSSPATLHLDSPTGSAPPLDVSRDGRTVVFAALAPSGVRQLYLRGPGDALPRAIPDTQGAEVPFFSPDAKQIGFTLGDGGRMRRVTLSDNSVKTILETDAVIRGASWGPGNRIVFGQSDKGIWQVTAGGDELQQLTQVAPNELHHRWPQLLPDGEHVLFTVQLLDRSVEPRIISIGSGEIFPVGVQGSLARYLHGGYIIYMRGKQVWAVRFDLATKQRVGDPALVVSGIHVPRLGNPHLAVTAAGVLVYEPTRPLSPGRSLVWVDREGNKELIEEGKGYEFPRLSPDGGELVCNHHNEANSHEIWRINLRRSPPTATPITSRENFIKPTWSPDGKAIIFSRFGDRSLWIQDLNGGTPRRKLHEKFGKQFPLQWRDGSLLLQEALPGRGVNLVELQLDGLVIRTLMKTPDAEEGGTISPSGRWLAYVSDKTAQPEVYLRSYPDLGPEELVSTNGGTEPLWSRDGSELFYRKGRFVFSVRMDGDQIGEPTPLFEGTFVDGFLHTANYDINEDGTRFVMVDGGWGLTQGRLDVHLQFTQELEAAFAPQK